MRRAITAMVTAAAIAASTIAVPKPAEARCWGCWVGAGIAAGVIGGALLAGAPYGYGPYYGYPAYYGGYAPYGGYGYAPAYYYGGYYAPRVYYAAPIDHGYYHPYVHHYYAHRYYARHHYGHGYYR